ncbi:MAG: branched-subunit amino acid transport protein [Ilumatobacter sp.]
MNNRAALFVLAAATLGTYAFRAGLILLLADRSLPTAVERALQNVGPAVLAALTVNLAVTGDGGASVDVDAIELASLGIAAVVGLRTKNLVFMLIAGMAALLILTEIF